MKRFILLLMFGMLLASACPRETSLSGGDKAVNMSKQDLAQRMSVSEEEISVVSVMETTAETTGYVVVLEAQGAHYEYYSINSDSAILRETYPTRPGITKITMSPTSGTDDIIKNGLIIPTEPTGLMDSKPWMPVN